MIVYAGDYILEVLIDALVKTQYSRRNFFRHSNAVTNPVGDHKSAKMYRIRVKPVAAVTSSLNITTAQS